jgi:hypothetical protein
MEESAKVGSSSAAWMAAGIWAGPDGTTVARGTSVTVGAPATTVGSTDPQPARANDATDAAPMQSFNRTCLMSGTVAVTRI